MNDSNSRGKMIPSVLLGVIFITLCLIGVYTVFHWCYEATKKIADNTAEKAKYEQMFMPVVMYDPPDFTDASTCDNEFLLQTSLWGCLLSTDMDSVWLDEFNQVIIPATDVNAMANRLFGPSVQLRHKTIGDVENTYRFDEDKKCYHAPIIAMSGFAQPKIDHIRYEKDLLEIIVGYVPPTTLLSIRYSETGMSEEEPMKFMNYELHENDGHYFIYSVRNITSEIDPSMELMPQFNRPIPHTDILEEDAEGTDAAADAPIPD